MEKLFDGRCKALLTKREGLYMGASGLADPAVVTDPDLF